MPKKSIQSHAHLFLDLLDSSYQGKAWHGPALKSTLKGLTIAEALFRPKPHTHNIWELALHCAYWKYRVVRQLVQVPCPRFPLRGANWFPRTGGTASQWNDERKILDQQHKSLQAAILALPPARLQLPEIAHLVGGIALHDTYHAGQVKFIRRYRSSKKRQP
ncbi:MAG TPA: DinB family protein [Candidatus Saccharimonadales bacterium]|jgi:hypothetical protein|nr:DinB family protein [Candidatus Saccharimonadales bacterium]